MRLIDADALLSQYNESAIVELGEYGDGCLDIISDIEHAPTIDAVPVVRCKDCKYKMGDICACPMAVGWDALEPEDDDFCSRGELNGGAADV